MSDELDRQADDDLGPIRPDGSISVRRFLAWRDDEPAQRIARLMGWENGQNDAT